MEECCNEEKIKNVRFVTLVKGFPQFTLQRSFVLCCALLRCRICQSMAQNFGKISRRLIRKKKLSCVTAHQVLFGKKVLDIPKFSRETKLQRRRTNVTKEMLLGLFLACLGQCALCDFWRKRMKGLLSTTAILKALPIRLYLL